MTAQLWCMDDDCYESGHRNCGQNADVARGRDMAERGAELVRLALDEGVLTHTGRSVGDLASERVAEEIVAVLTVNGLCFAGGCGCTCGARPLPEEGGRRG